MVYFSVLPIFFFRRFAHNEISILIRLTAWEGVCVRLIFSSRSLKQFCLALYFFFVFISSIIYTKIVYMYKQCSQWLVCSNFICTENYFSFWNLNKNFKRYSFVYVLYLSLCIVNKRTLTSYKNALSTIEICGYGSNWRECSSKFRIQLASVWLVESLQTLHMIDIHIRYAWYSSCENRKRNVCGIAAAHDAAC